MPGLPSVPVWLVLSAAMLAVLAYGYCVGISQGCLHIGRGISDTGSKTGYQDAVSPPTLARCMILSQVIFLFLLGYSFWQFGIWAVIGEMAGALVVFGIGALWLPPKPEAAYYARLTYISLRRREANYAKKNDMIRAGVARELAQLIAERFADKLTASVRDHMGLKNRSKL